MLDSEHGASEQLGGARLDERGTLDMYLGVYKHVLYPAEEDLFTFLLSRFS